MFSVVRNERRILKIIISLSFFEREIEEKFIFYKKVF